MVKVVVYHTLDAEFFGNEEKNRASFVAPKDGRGGGLLVACLIEAFVE